MSTGTTLVAVEFNGGVVIGADSRTSMVGGCREQSYRVHGVGFRVHGGECGVQGVECGVGVWAPNCRMKG